LNVKLFYAVIDSFTLKGQKSEKLVFVCLTLEDVFTWILSNAGNYPPNGTTLHRRRLECWTIPLWTPRISRSIVYVTV